MTAPQTLDSTEGSCRTPGAPARAGPLDRFCGALSAIEFSPLMLALVPVVIAGGRGAQELAIAQSRSVKIPFLDYILCYSILQLAMIAVLAVTTGREYRRFVGVVSVGMLLGWLPPVIDTALRLFGVERPDAWYRFPLRFDWDFFSPHQALGESITVWLTIAFTGLFVAWFSRSWLRALAALALTYATIQMAGCGLPLLGKQIGALVGDMRHLVPLDWLYLLGLCAIYVALNRRTTGPSLRRAGHAVLWGMVTAVGAGLGEQGWDVALNRGLVMFCAAQLALIANDYFDRDADALAGGLARPVTRDDLVFFVFVQCLVAAQAHAVHRHGFVYPMTFIVLWALYHLPTIRLKRVFGVAYAMEGIGAMLCLVYGMHRSHGFALQHDAVVLCSAIAGVGFMLGSLIKDYKDIEQDRAAGIRTVYTLLVAGGASLPVVHRWISAGLTAVLLLPVITLAAYGYRGAGLAVPLAIACLPQMLLTAVHNRRAAVEAGIWAVNLYLLVLAGVVATWGGMR